jgi:hypothetical protein
VRVLALLGDGRVVRLPLTALFVSLALVLLVGVVPGASSAPVAVAVGFGPSTGLAVLAGTRDTVGCVPLLGVVPALTVVAVVIGESLLFGGPDEMVWLVLTFLP